VSKVIVEEAINQERCGKKIVEEAGKKYHVGVFF